MANWRAITEADIATRLSGAELAAYRNAALDAGEGDPVALLIAAVTDLVRGYVAGCSRNTLGADGQVPKVLIDNALSIIVLRIMSRCYGEVLDLTGQRKSDAEAAILVLRDVAKCEGPMIPGPASDDDTGVDTGRPAINYDYAYDHDEDFERQDQDGL